jgi:hypothetical protein
MSSVQEPHLHLEVGHILFLDIVGYSKLLADEQKELVQELNQIVRETKQFRAAEAEGKLTRIKDATLLLAVGARQKQPRARNKRRLACLMNFRARKASRLCTNKNCSSRLTQYR